MVLSEVYLPLPVFSRVSRIIRRR